MKETAAVYADAGDSGLSFILPSSRPEIGGLVRNLNEGHFGTIVGRGGSGKSILALQLVTQLLEGADEKGQQQGLHPTPDRPHSAFYFSLEASPQELARQIEQFKWGVRYRWATRNVRASEPPRVSGDDAYSNGLYLIRVPPPAESLNALSLKIRQSIANELNRIKSLAAIVIDPMGAVNAGEDLRTNLIQLKELAETHRTFVFLLTEKYAFERYTSIEHYSQSIIHLEHDPGQQPHRRLYVQKARGQSFRSGYHYFELQQPPNGSSSSRKGVGSLSRGVRVFPSIAAQSAYAHERLSVIQRPGQTPQNAEEEDFFPNEHANPFLRDREKIEQGSAVFLMGPPGSFKEHVCSEFAEAAARKGGATIYISFKADFQAIEAAMSRRKERREGRRRLHPQAFDSRDDRPESLDATTYFFDGRSPLLTPEEILFTVRNFITPSVKQRAKASAQPALKKKPAVGFRRAVIWGLRRLYDFPNFKEGRVVQFLEALVTMLKSEQITTLLVDWPDKLTGSTVPIVDLCQYIFLTRVCYTAQSPEAVERISPRDLQIRKESVDALWSGSPKQVALLRAQRTRHGVHHDQGAIFRQVRRDGKLEIDRLSVSQVMPTQARNFERLWLHAGIRWEEDLSLLS